MLQATVIDSPQASLASINSTTQLWAYNRALLQQGVDMIDLLQAQACPEFRYAQAVGPHLRHIIEHYQALLNTLADPDTDCVDYDARNRALDVQSDPAVTRQRLQAQMAVMEQHAQDPRLSLSMALTTRLQAGTVGELAVSVVTTLGRELLFVGSHTTHHYALLAHYCQAAGVSLGADFGKAPATVAFERRAAATQAA
ncbi:hypothetical protein [Hydrogenophaga sp. PAMC20947]|uniref:hypothetical protein n=1 Tax=Hydrogenophaga sp. PAMC20947 TaxID=2565558 RepID=UPI00109E23A2|nr:hypothetical protein [Hydrogenophaga sp. PAMC20947]QCB45615.1 hypothetical protein E5678_06000 [Hydrogenophaga sp. PAMC20947]